MLVPFWWGTGLFVLFHRYQMMSGTRSVCSGNFGNYQFYGVFISTLDSDGSELQDISLRQFISNPSDHYSVGIPPHFLTYFTLRHPTAPHDSKVLRSLAVSDTQHESVKSTLGYGRAV